MSGAADTNSPSKSSLQFLLGADSPPDFEPGLAGTEVDGLQQSRPEESVGELTPASRLERALSHNKASLQFIVSANDSSDVLSPESTDDIAVIAALVTLAATSDPDAARLSIEEDEGNAKANNQGKRKRRTRKCKIPDCVNNAINRGACFRHGVKFIPTLNSISHLTSDMFKSAGRQEVLCRRLQLECKECGALLASR